MGDFLGGPWDLDVFLIVNLVLAAALYLAGVRLRRDRTAIPPWPVGRTIAFLSGLVLLALVWLGPVAGWSHTFFWTHMTQHLVVMMLAAPLLVLGSPLLLLRDASSPRVRDRYIDPALNSTVTRWVTDPAITWVLFAAVLIGTHFSPFYDWALRNHDAELFLERPLFLGAALLYYLPIIGSNPLPRRPTPAVKLLSLGALMIPEAIVGAVIYFAPVVLYSTFAQSVRPFGPDPLSDQRLSGAIMWAVVMVIDTMWMMVVAVEWFNSEEERSRAMDVEIAAGQHAATADQSTA